MPRSEAVHDVRERPLATAVFRPFWHGRGTAAAYLIGGGCSDDGFTDFRFGVIAQGRDWYEKAAACPDSLADHPAVAGAELPLWHNPLCYEEAGYAAYHAFERVTGDEHAFEDAWFSRHAPGGYIDRSQSMNAFYAPSGRGTDGNPCALIVPGGSHD